MPTARRPAALLPAPVARTVGFALLATLGAAEWVRMVGDGDLLIALPWVLVAVLAGEAVGAAGSLAPRLRVPAAVLAAALGLGLAALASGLEPRLLAPRHWDELGDGVARGLETLSGVTLPYGGVDPWPDITLRLGGALLVTLAAVLAAWPRAQGRGFPFFALAALLVLVATPVTAIGTPRSLVLGVAIAALTVCFLWLERLPLRPGVGVAVLAGIAFAGALPLSFAADRDSPWFDYSELGRGAGDAGVGALLLGPLLWPDHAGSGRGARCCASARRGRSTGSSRTSRTSTASAGSSAACPTCSARSRRPTSTRTTPRTRSGRGAARVTVRGLRGDALAGAGTTTSVDAGERRAIPTFSPGTWRADRELAAGDSYQVRFYAPRPNPLQLAAASSGARGQQSDALEVLLPLTQPELPDPGDTRSRPVRALKLEPPPYAVHAPLLARNERRGTTEPGLPVLRNSPYLRTWRLAQRLKRGARNPYEFARRIDLYFDAGFRYDERPVPPPEGVPPLEHFLFESKAGYCQHYSGAMALLLRMGGVPARVATGFSPGGFRRRQGEWVVRDRDAHSWVEAWFDGIGWVTFDPTPAATPARSLIAAINAPTQSAAADPGSGAPSVQPGTRNPAGARGELDQPGAGGSAADLGDDGGPSPWLYAVAGVALLAVIAAGLLLWRRRRRRPTGPALGRPHDRRPRHRAAPRRPARPPGRDADRARAPARRRRLPGRAALRPLRRHREPADARAAARVPPRARGGARLARARARLVGAAAYAAVTTRSRPARLAW